MGSTVVGLLTALVLLGGCAGEAADLSVTVAQDLAPKAPHVFSMFGVFRDGRMSARAWDDLSPKLALMFGPDPCPAAFSTDLITESGNLASAVDEYARSYGVTEPLIDQLAPAARGDLVLVVVVSGAVRSKNTEAQPRPQPAPGPSRMRRTSTLAHGPRSEVSAFDVTLSVFAPKEHKMVAALNLHYVGTSEDSAFSKILARWADLFPHVRCDGWDFQNHPVDAETIRALPEP